MKTVMRGLLINPHPVTLLNKIDERVTGQTQLLRAGV